MSPEPEETDVLEHRGFTKVAHIFPSEAFFVLGAMKIWMLELIRG